MRSARATFVVALTSTLLGAVPAAALAAPTDVHVRVEGVNATLFDRVVRTEGHTISAASDAAPRVCDGTNADRYPAPVATPTTATVDAMTTIGQDFDALWYEGFDDYFLKRWGPEPEDNAKSWWWGVLVNGSFTPVGGCQKEVVSGDEVLWVNDAFSGRPFLWLSAPATAVAGQPVTVNVASNTGNGDATSAYEGATVGGVTAAAAPTAPGVVDAGTSAANGDATVVFHQAGWQRVKARAAVVGDKPAAIASNSVDVCVEATPGDGCAGLPPSRQPVAPGGREPEPREPEPRAPEPRAPEPRAPQPRQPEPSVDPPAPRVDPPARRADPPTPAPSAPPVRIGRPRLVTDGARSGRVGVRWRVLDAGVGVRGWTIASRALGARGARWVERAAGDRATSASLRLAAGTTHALRLTVTDALGRSSATTVGRVLVPLDDRARGVRRSGPWSAVRDRDAWLGTVSRGRTGARLRVSLGAGRPTVVLRGASAGARIELRSAHARRVVRLSPRASKVVLPRQAKAGAVTLRVLSGTVDVDGVGLAP